MPGFPVFIITVLTTNNRFVDDSLDFYSPTLCLLSLVRVTVIVLGVVVLVVICNHIFPHL